MEYCGHPVLKHFFFLTECNEQHGAKPLGKTAFRFPAFALHNAFVNTKKPASCKYRSADEDEFENYLRNVLGHAPNVSTKRRKQKKSGSSYLVLF